VGEKSLSVFFWGGGAMGLDPWIRIQHLEVKLPQNLLSESWFVETKLLLFWKALAAKQYSYYLNKSCHANSSDKLLVLNFWLKMSCILSEKSCVYRYISTKNILPSFNMSIFIPCSLSLSFCFQFLFLFLVSSNFFSFFFFFFFPFHIFV
jgi:hypothetical protein